MTNEFSEPWKFVSPDYVNDTSDNPVYSTPFGAEEGYGFESPEHLARSVACVNACAGLSDEQLAMIPRLFETLAFLNQTTIDPAVTNAITAAMEEIERRPSLVHVLYGVNAVEMKAAGDIEIGDAVNHDGSVITTLNHTGGSVFKADGPRLP